ncbi:hypothetical protein EV383_2425 [Pseudonocardia sediminis]|uniref:Uncharacterized protein n=1 Tax=Pseudonocardia sediminis TaxID=1397368 RepID=A0A4Q7UUK0_PSEST|nr:hypothetical protein [Pseudonocardia sediminis]RZT85552.1 hypothetical protein EV383_2425 [Pseudonocardia sediminis]
MAENRYRQEQPVDPQTDAEARALRTIAGLLDGDNPVVGDRAVAGQVGQVLRSSANELAHGRALPIPVRRAVLGLADAIRAALDPRTHELREP